MNLPNKLSLFRLFLVPLFAFSFFLYNADNIFFRNLPIIIFSVAVITDAIDGIIARSYGQVTKLGQILDPAADKLLLDTAFLILAFAKIVPSFFRIPVWVACIVFGRDLFMIMGAVIIYKSFNYLDFKPTLVGKFTTLIQVLTIFAILLNLRYSFMFLNITVFFTVLSGFHYLIIGTKTWIQKK
jgi:cardiolipin synthase